MAAGADRRHGRRRVCAAGVMPADMDADIAAVMAAARVLSEQSLQESHGAFLRIARLRRCSRSKVHWDTAAVRRVVDGDHLMWLSFRGNPASCDGQATSSRADPVAAATRP